MKYLVYILLCLSLLSCKKWNQSTEEDPIAKVNGNYLYPSDVSFENELIPDSVSWNQEQVNHWLKKQLWLMEAEKSKSLTDVERKVQDYKESLLVDAYKKEVIQKANLVVTEDMMLNYYKEHQSSFLLNEEMFEVQSFLLENTEENESLIESVSNEEFGEEVKAFCQASPNNCLMEASWVTKSFFEDLGMPSYLWVRSTKFQKYFIDDNYVCLYRIYAKKNKGEPAPLEEVKGDIKQILLVELEKELLQKKEDELFINAQNKKSFEIY